MVDSQSIELQGALLRQRRFVLLMSLAVIAYYCFGVELKQEASFSGLGMKITRPGNVVFALWVVWFWSVWRYSQRVYELLSVVWRELIDDIDAEDHRIGLAKAKKFGNNLASQGLIEELPKSARIEDSVTIGELSDDHVKTFEVFEGRTLNRFRGYFPNSDGGRTYPSLRANFYWRDGTKWGSPEEAFEMQLSPREANWLRFRAWLHALLRLPAFTEYFFPMLVAFAAAGVGIVRLYLLLS